MDSYPTHDYPIEKQITEINDQILSLGNNGGYNIIELHDLFIDDQGKMIKELARDGLHLNQNNSTNTNNNKTKSNHNDQNKNKDKDKTKNKNKNPNKNKNNNKHKNKNKNKNRTLQTKD